MMRFQGVPWFWKRTLRDLKRLPPSFSCSGGLETQSNLVPNPPDFMTLSGLQEGGVGRWVAACLLFSWAETGCRRGVGGVAVTCLCSPLEKELTSSGEETRGANVKI